jgi:hypothetical protein
MISSLEGTKTVWSKMNDRPTSIYYNGNGGCAWETFGSAGFLYLRFISPRTAATIRLRTNVVALTLIQEFVLMPAIDPSKICVPASLVNTHNRPKTGGAQ